MVTIKLYNYNGENNVINKEFGKEVATLNGYLYGTTSILNPIVQIQPVDQVFNYVYIEQLDRYYFVDSIDIKNNNLMELILSIDVLTTYQEQILNAEATLFMGEQMNFLNTTQPVYDIRDIMEMVEFVDKFNHDGTIIMVTTRGQRE